MPGVFFSEHDNRRGVRSTVIGAPISPRTARYRSIPTPPMLATTPTTDDAQEIERKFLVREVPDALEEQPHEAIRQGYLAMMADGSAVRIREKGDRFFQTLKRGTGLERAEVEIELTPDQFDTLWPLTEGRRVEKTRYEVPYGEYTIELDMYHGRLAPLVTAEVEFESKEASREFGPPDWFGEEVTSDERFSNLSLARYGRPPHQ